jgi:hypothetical protein
MGKVYKDKKGSSCKLCKPHKAGWTPKKKLKTRVKEKSMEKEVKEFLGGFKESGTSLSHEEGS